MSERQQRVDELGFPIPPGFDNDEPQRQPSVWRTSRALRLTMGIALAVAIGAILFGPSLKTYGRQAMASRLAQRANEKFEQADANGALADIEQAVEWLPDEPELIYRRAFYRLQAGDLEGSLEDYDRVISMSPSFSRAYTQRSVVYQRLGRHHEAIDDTTQAIALRPDWDHMALNHRAYTRAIAGIELEEGLEDIQKAIKLADKANAAYLDTRGYLLYLLGKHEEALADMDRALKIAERERQQIKQLAAEGDNQLAMELTRADQDLAVMYHHRGLIYRKLGQNKQAEADLALGKKLGYDPAKGIY